MTAFTIEEIKKHTSKESCWVIIEGKVYDMTSFLSDHPGGTKALLRKAGKDATKDFNMIHPSSVKKQLEKFYIGDLEGNSAEPSNSKKPSGASGTPVSAPAPSPTQPADAPFVLPALDAMLKVDDFEHTAKHLLSKQGWAYYWSASDDQITKSYNRDVYKSVLLRPRIFRDVVQCDTSTSIVGLKTKLPVFISPAAMARLAHPSGEQGIAWAAAQKGVVQMISNNASMGFDEIVLKDYKAPHAPQFMFQLYVQSERQKSDKNLDAVLATGKCSAIVLTLDAPVPGKREEDEKAKDDEIPVFDESDPWPFDKPDAAGGIGKKLFAGTSAALVWNDIKWLSQKCPGLPIILKGVQTCEDVIIASKHPQIKGVILSNHGGRAMDTCQPPLLVLQELRTYAPHLFDKLEIYLDGGIRRGTDVVKALCLGAKQVGIGRPALFSLAGYGQYGPLRVLDIFQQEIETCMRLLGVNSIEELGPEYVNCRQLESLIAKL